MIFSIVGGLLLLSPLWGVIASALGWVDLRPAESVAEPGINFRALLPFFAAVPFGIALLVTGMYRYRMNNN